MDREDKLVVCRKHPCAYIFPALIVAIVVREIIVFKGKLVVEALQGDDIAIGMIITALLAILYIVISYLTNYLILTPTEVIGRRNLFNTCKIPRSHIKACRLEYPLLGYVFRYCTVELYCWGDDEPSFYVKTVMRGPKFAKTGS